MPQSIRYRLPAGQTLTVTPTNGTALVRSTVTGNVFVSSAKTYGPYTRDVDFIVDGDARAVTADYTGAVGVTSSTVANLPSAATAGTGAAGFVTDATSATFGAALVGGGSNKVPVYSDGASWFVG